jgi:hypothetical protein
MPLKLKKSQTPSEPINRKDETEGSWGRINPEPQSVVVFRLCKKTSSSTEETYSYPYRVLSSWHWRGGVGEEELKIAAGSDLVVVRGRGLDRIVEALDRNALETLCEVRPNDESRERLSVFISSIQVANQLEVKIECSAP